MEDTGVKKLVPTVIFEDDNIVVINKPAGLMVHPDGKSDEYTLCDWFVSQNPDCKDVGEPIEIIHKGENITIQKPGIVHRLDKETSGVMVLVKNQPTFLFVKRQFKNHTIRKIYRAFVYGFLKEDIGLINAPIGRSVGDIRMWNAGRGARGELREATTRYRTLARFSDLAANEYETQQPPLDHRYSYVELYPMTGRTHQLRVHMKFINHAIVSDYLYASNKEKALGFNRVALHAHSLELEMSNGERRKFEAPMPEDFEKVLLLANN